MRHNPFTPPPKWIVKVAVVFLWLFAVVAAYFWVHKPFDAGIVTVPFSRDFSTAIFMVPYFYKEIRRIERRFSTLDMIGVKLLYAPAVREYRFFEHIPCSRQGFSSKRVEKMMFLYFGLSKPRKFVED